MQPKYAHDKSNIIKITEEAKRKSRQRLIGSVVLLFFALVLLLNVTSQIKPVSINPKAVEIAGIDNSNKINTQVNLTPNQAESTADNDSINADLSAQQNLMINSADAIAIESKSINQAESATNQAVAPIKAIPNDTAAKPNQAKAKQAIDPIALLDGLVEYNETPITTNDSANQAKLKNRYIQFAALKSSDKAYAIKQQLHEQGINASIATINTPNGLLYRLRAGPFPIDKANDILNELKTKGFSGIVTK